MKGIAFSDTHGQHEMLNQYLYDPEFTKDVELIIFTGDESVDKDPFSNEFVTKEFLKWYDELPFKYKIYIAGNHSTAMAKGLIDMKEYPSIIHLENSSVDIEGIKIWGSPYSLAYGTGWAYQLKHTKALNLWSTIPADVDIILTHGPCKYIGDTGTEGTSAGDKTLFNVVRQREPKFFMCGHFHDMQKYGMYNYGVYQNWGITFINSTVTDLRYNVINPPIKFEVE